ncbi:MAG: alpha/beta fold hydrolase [Thermoanaerobaculia bacterium]
MRRLRIAAALLVAGVVAAPAFAQKFKLPEKPAEKTRPAEAPKPAEPAPPAPAPEAKTPKPFPSPQVRLPADMKFREGTSEVFGQRINWFEIGEGPAIVLLHGVAGDRRDWVGVMRKLHAGHRVIAFDAPGFGDSAKPGISYSVETIADFLDGFFAAQKIERATLVGHSIGAWAAAIFAQQHPDRVDHLVAIAPMGLGAGVDPRLLEILLPSSREDVRKLLTLLYAKPAASPDSAALDALYARVLARGDAGATDSILRNARGGWFEGDLPPGLPVLIVAGSEDGFAPEAEVLKAQAIASSARLTRVPGCGHMVHVECAGEVAAAIGEFIAAR